MDIWQTIPLHYITLGTCTGHFQHECWK
jgi:hypothetical protein